MTTAPSTARRPLTAMLFAAALGLSACTGSTAATSAPSTVAGATTATTQAPAANASPTETVAPTDTVAPTISQAPASGPTAVPTAIDPCQLITAQEAGGLAGTTFGAGKEQNLSGNSRMCSYGSQTKIVFEVIVAIAPDVATAKQEEASAEADLQANAAQLNQGMTITKLPGFAPNADAVLLELKPNAAGIAGRSIFVLRGTSFFAFSDLALGSAAPSADAMKAQAITTLGKLP